MSENQPASKKKMPLTRSTISRCFVFDPEPWRVRGVRHWSYKCFLCARCAFTACPTARNPTGAIEVIIREDELEDALEHLEHHLDVVHEGGAREIPTGAFAEPGRSAEQVLTDELMAHHNANPDMGGHGQIYAFILLGLDGIGRAPGSSTVHSDCGSTLA